MGYLTVLFLAVVIGLLVTVLNWIQKIGVAIFTIAHIMYSITVVPIPKDSEPGEIINELLKKKQEEE